MNEYLRQRLVDTRVTQTNQSKQFGQHAMRPAFVVTALVITILDAYRAARS